MKKLLLIAGFAILSCAKANAQFFNLTVINGYGSGSYEVGDTVHVWSEEYDNSKIFSTWSGDIQYLESPKEWHTTLIMPNQHVSVTAVTSNMPFYIINQEQIMGAANLKNVYSYFPANLNGVIYLFHGTGGNASNWINTSEYRSFVNAAIAVDFGVIVTEAEEITLNTDLNGDGKLRWQAFPIDTVNGIDYLNIKALTDTFVNRGDLSYSTPRFSVGMSNGGSFSAAISYAFNYQAGISYCASSVQGIFGFRNNPFAFRMAKYDDNAEVGPQGNYEAWQHDSILESRGICHDYEIHDRQPIYPQRFARVPGISTTVSQNIFNNLATNNQLDADNYALHSDSIRNHVLLNPSLYPAIISLPPSLQTEALNQIAASNAEHKFYSDYNFETLDFIINLCSTAGSINDIPWEQNELMIYPNPADEQIQFDLPEGENSLIIFNSIGQKVFDLEKANGLIIVDVGEFTSGIYAIQVTNKRASLVSKWIKQ